MQASTATLPTVTVTGRQRPDDVTVVVRGRAWGGWTDVRITRGIERLPSDFELKLTEFTPGEKALAPKLGDSCQVLIGTDLVLTGYVERITRALGPRQHTVTISGRSRCADLVDCSAEWKGGQIVGASVFEIAKTLAAPYGIGVSAPGAVGPASPQFNLMRGETPFQIVERLCRFGQLLAYDTPSGDLILTTAGTTNAASGLSEGVNVLEASFEAGMDQRFSEIVSYQQSMATLDDLGSGGDLQATVVDEAVPRHRRRIVISETSGSIGWEIAKQRAAWEVRRRYGRANTVRVKTDSWRDSDGVLYAPNVQALVKLPTLKLPSVQLTIGEVTYVRGEGGTTCDLVLMPAEAFTPEPFNIVKLLPFAELADIATKVKK